MTITPFACFLALAVLCLGFNSVPGRAADPASGKIIAFAGNEEGVWATPQTVKRYFQQWETWPFDGFVYNLSHRNGKHLGMHLLDSTTPWSPDSMRPEIEIMKSLPFKQLRHNYVLLGTSELRDDWFDDKAWAELIRRTGWFAGGVRETGAAGILLDVEQYNKELKAFSYQHQPQRDQHTFAEYQTKARQRGAEFMRAIRHNFPGAEVYLTYGTSMLLARGQFVPDTYEMGLLVGFFDGLLEEAVDGCKVFDGFEGAYDFRTVDEFARAADIVRNTAVKFSANPGIYRDRTRLGFGIWPTSRNLDGKGWHLYGDDFTKNHHTPLELANALHHALRYSDGIVWVWGGGLYWNQAPKEYLDAIRNARTPRPDADLKMVRPGLDADRTIFAPLYKQYREVFDFPTEWQFRVDPKDEGVNQKWFTRETPAGGDWRQVRIRDFWDSSLEKSHHGYGWYRIEFEADKSWLADKLLLAFGGVDELAWVYLNGQKVVEHAESIAGWDQPFHVDVSKQLKPGRNVLAVRVHNSVGPGGIWRGVKLFGALSATKTKAAH